MGDSKIMTAIEAPNIRQLINIVNEMEIAKEDIVAILPMKEGYIMIYYK